MFEDTPFTNGQKQYGVSQWYNNIKALGSFFNRVINLHFNSK